MRTAVTLSVSLTLAVALAFGGAACQKTEQPATQAAYPTRVPGTTAAQQAPVPTDGNAQTAPGLAASPVVALAPLSNPSAPLSQPNALALPCSTDAQCLTHRCNVAAGKCAWPCQSDNDCVPGNACVAPTCLPKLQ